MTWSKPAVRRILAGFLVLFLPGILQTARGQTVFLDTNPPYRMYDDSRALVIGNVDYVESDGWPDLPAVESELPIITEALQSQGFKVEVLKDANSNTMQKALRNFLKQKVGRDTRLVVYFAGHGATDRQTKSGYILPTDIGSDEDPAFEATALSMEELKVWAASSKAKHVLLVFNSCFSGSVFLARRNVKPGELFIKDVDRPGLQFITSGSAGESVPDNVEFGRAFADGLEGKADLNRDGIVTAWELGYFIKDALLAQGNQTPQYGTDTSFERRNGNLLFIGRRNDVVATPASTTPSSDTVQTSDPLQIGALLGPRQALLRSIGIPERQEASIYAGLDVIYYQKVADGTDVSDALDRAGIPYSVTRALLPDRLKVNAIACGPDIPAETIRDLARKLLASGMPLQRIYGFRRPQEKPRRIEIVSVVDDAVGYSALDSKPLTMEQINGLTSCPRYLSN